MDFNFKKYIENQESTAFTRARRAAALGLGPDVPQPNSHSTASPWELSKLKKKKKGKPATVNKDIDRWLNDVDGLKKDTDAYKDKEAKDKDEQDKKAKQDEKDAKDKEKKKPEVEEPEEELDKDNKPKDKTATFGKPKDPAKTKVNEQRLYSFSQWREFNKKS